MSLGAEARSKRFQLKETEHELSVRAYNLVMSCTVLYGLLINAITCTVFKEQVLQMDFMFVTVAYIICALVGVFMAAFSSNPVISFIGYNLIVIPLGLMLTPIIAVYTIVDPSVITQALLLTAIITAAMIIASILKPDFFSKLGAILFVCLTGLLFGSLIMLIFHIDSVIYAYISAVVFSLYIGYDFWRSQEYVKTLDNAVDSAVDIYLDIINLFLDLLKILSKSKSRK